MGQSMLQLARAQDQTNQQLQQHLQQGQLNMQAHTGALQQLATSTYQCNFDHIFASIPIYDGSDREGFFPWLEWLEAACFYSGRNIKMEALGRSTGPAQNVIMALPNARSWRAIREELKRCFSDQTSLGHVAAQLEIWPRNQMNLWGSIFLDTQRFINLWQNEMLAMILILLDGLDFWPALQIWP